jgi:hypothetical protein
MDNKKKKLKIIHVIFKISEKSHTHTHIYKRGVWSSNKSNAEKNKSSKNKKISI